MVRHRQEWMKLLDRNWVRDEQQLKDWRCDNVASIYNIIIIIVTIIKGKRAPALYFRHKSHEVYPWIELEPS